jgi:hypothetical protein
MVSRGHRFAAAQPEVVGSGSGTDDLSLSLAEPTTSGGRGAEVGRGLGR